MKCYEGTMSFFLLQILVSPPQVKFNTTDLVSPEVKQYITDSCNFYHDKSGVWLTGTDNELDKEILSKYGAEFMQKVKEPESIKERAQAYIQLSNETQGKNETPYNKTYLEEWIKNHGSSSTHYWMEQAARLIDQQTKSK